MKLQIENWIDNNGFSKNVNILFYDSIICYKSGANRASLLFSYLAFLTILKERIIGGVKPPLFEQGEWENIILKLQNDDLWEASVFDATQQQEKINQETNKRKKDPIFNINENLRLQIKYWKDRRNDCAHYKDNIIDTFNVESFWAFIQSNMHKISIEGGKQSLINKISNHFDSTITPPDKDITPLIREVEYSVERTNLKDFWHTLLNSDEWNYELNRKKHELISRSLEVNNDIVNESLISIIKNNDNHLSFFLSNHPDKILRFNFTPEEIRKIWKKKLVNFNDILGIYSTLLRNGLIPQNEIAEANKTVISTIKEYSPSNIDNQLLTQHGFLDQFKEEILYNENFCGKKSYNWVNAKADIISGVIKNYSADIDIAKRLVEHYTQLENSDWLLERLNYIFSDNSQMKTDYKIILQANNCEIPAKLKKYFE